MSPRARRADVKTAKPAEVDASVDDAAAAEAAEVDADVDDAGSAERAESRSKPPEGSGVARGVQVAPYVWLDSRGARRAGIAPR